MLTTDASKDRTGFTLCTEPAGDLWRPGKCGLPDASHANCTKHNHCANHAHNAGHAHEAGHARHTGHAHDLGSLDPERVSSTWPGEAGPRHPRRLPKYAFSQGETLAECEGEISPSVPYNRMSCRQVA